MDKPDDWPDWLTALSIVTVIILFAAYWLESALLAVSYIVSVAVIAAIYAVWLKVRKK